MVLVSLDFLSFLFGSVGLNSLSQKIEKSAQREVIFPSGKVELVDKIIFQDHEFFSPSAFPETVRPQIKAKSAILWIPETGEVLFAKNPNEKSQIGSITKIFTALFAYKKYTDLNASLTVPVMEISSEESQVWLTPGTNETVRTLFRDLLVPSGNDAAWTFAGGYKNEISNQFIKDLNLMVKNDLGLQNTTVVDPSGIDADGQFSTAFDVALGSYYLLKNDFLREIVSTKEYTRTTSIYGQKKFYNTNQLLSYPYLDIRGTKTGTTDSAGPSLSTYARLKNGNTLICVVLNSPDRFQECKALLSWGSELVE